MLGLEPTQVAALVAATHAVAVRASLSTECGQLKEVVSRGSDGYLAVYAAGRGGPVIVAVLGSNELNVAMLNFQARKTIDRIAQHSAGLARRPRAGSPASPKPARPKPDNGGRPGREPAGPDGPLPARPRRK
jgi:hypothetical protein